MKKFEFLVLCAIVFIALALRLYKINRPIADWHSWRQADTAAVSRNFIKEGFTPFMPTFDDMSSQTNGIDNPNRYRFVEFPVYNILVYWAWLVTGLNTTVARLVTVFITLGSTIFLYLVVRKFSLWQVSALSAFFFATIPYNVFYSSTILPGPFMVFSVLALYFFFINYLEKEKIIYLVLSVIFANLAILSWPIALFFLIPLVYLAFEKYGLKTFIKINLWVFALLSLLPFAAWRLWIIKFPSGIPNWQFLINEGNIRFKGAFFRWIFEERLGRLILTVGGFALFVLGLIQKPAREKLFYYSLLFSCILYFIVFASGNIRHDYYQIPIIPALSIFMAIGMVSLLNLKSPFFNKYVAPFVAISLLLLMYAFGFYEVKGLYWINRPQIVEAGQAVDKLLPKDATVIAPYNGDTAFLYQTNRHGYPVVDRPLEKFIDSGTKYFVSVDVNDAGISNLSNNCKIIEKTATYVILELSKDCIGR